MMAPGIYYNIPNSDYHADRSAIGCSGLKAMLKAPAYYFGQYLDPECPPEPERESAGRFFGNLAHAVLFEYHTFNERYRVGPAVSSKALKAWKDFAADLPPGCIGITPDQYQCAQKIRASTMAVPDVARALAKGDGEVSAYWDDPETGVRCKCRPDWVQPVNEDSVIIWDGKSYETADPVEFARRQVGKMNYHLQAAWYTDGYARASGKKVLGFVFLVIEDAFPHIVKAMMLDEASLEVGRRKYREALNSYAQCQKSGVWPGLGDDIALIELPYWAQGKDL